MVAGGCGALCRMQGYAGISGNLFNQLHESVAAGGICICPWTPICVAANGCVFHVFGFSGRSSEKS